jgi:hypothetical protein
VSIEAAIDANAPLQDDFENNGPVDSDEERDAVMAAISRSCPQPLVTHTLIPSKKKYHYVRMKEMLSNVLGGARGGGLFSTGDSNSQAGRGLFQTDSPTLISSALPETSGDTSKKSTTGQSTANRPATNASAAKTAVAATS